MARVEGTEIDVDVPRDELASPPAEETSARADTQILEFFVRSMFGPSRPERPVVELPPEVVDGQVNAYASFLRERVDVELCYLENVCGLDGAACATLTAEGERVMASIRAELRRVIQRGGGEDQVAIVVSGETLEIPAGVDERLFAVDELLADATGKLAAGVPNKLAAERRRQSDIRKQAISAVGTVAVDHLVLLRARQRRDLQDLVAQNADDDTPMSLGAMLVVALMHPQWSEWLYETEAEKLGFTEQRLAAILTPNQMATWREQARAAEGMMVVPAAQGAVVMVDLDARIELEVFEEVDGDVAAPKEACSDGRDAHEGMDVKRELRRAELEGAAVLADAQIEVLEETIVVHGGPPTDQRPQLESLLQRSLDYVDAACDLTDDQRQKLVLAGQLDIAAALELMAEAQKAAAEAQARQAEEQQEEDDLEVVEFTAGYAPPAAAMFFDRSARFSKFLRSRLAARQMQVLADDRRERQASERQAVARAVACLLSESGKLTAAEHERLAATLQRELERLEIEPSAGPAPAEAHHLAKLPDEKLRPLFDARQWPAVSRRWSELREGLLEWFGPNGEAMIGGGP